MDNPTNHPGLTRREALLAGAITPVIEAGRLPPLPEPTYPDDAFSRPLDDLRPAFLTLDGVGPFLMVDERARRFADQDLSLLVDQGVPVTRWRFRSLGLDHNVLVIQERIRRAPVSISFRVANRSDLPIEIGVEVHEMGWLPVPENTATSWTLGNRQAVQPGRQQILRYMIGSAQAKGRDRIRYPLGAVALKLEGIRPNTPYEALLSDLTVHYAPAPGAAVDSIGVHTNGNEVRFGVKGHVSRDASPVDIECRRQDRVLWRVRLAGHEIAALANGACTVSRTAPWWLPNATYSVGLVVGGRRVTGSEARLTLSRKLPRAELPRTERRMHRGRPAVFIEGRPFNWRGYSSYEYVPGSVAEFGRSSADMFCIPTCAGRHMYQVASPTWPVPGRTDYSELDERVCFSLQANPKAMISLRVALAMPPWWLQRNLDELVRVDTDQGHLVWEEFTHARVASLASEKWFTDQARALRDLIGHCKSQPWASRLAAIWLMGETTEEWFAWGSNDRCYSDYSRPMATAFRAATGEPAIPSREQRTAPGWDVYPDTPDGRLAARYHGFLSNLTTRVVGQFAEVVKRETDRRTLVCCFLGYVIQLAGEPRQALSGHFGLRQAIDDPNVDMIAGVPLHDFRDLAAGYNPYCSATESILASGKLVCDENDLFSWLHNSLWHRPYDPANPRGAAISMHARECANDAVHGTIQQKFSLAASWHHDAELHRAFAQQARVYRDAMDADRSGTEEIAFVVDDTSFAWTPPESSLLAITNKHVLRDLGRTGAPVGVWLLSDIHRLPPRIRFVVVACSYAAAGPDILKLGHAISEGRRTFWVIGAPGMVDVEAHAWSPDRPAKLLEMPVSIRTAEATGAVVLTDSGRGLPSVARVRPRIEANAAGWLRYVDGPCAGLERPLPRGGRLIWSGVPVVSVELFRSWIERAGIHCYAPAGCFVHASRDLVAITAPADGTYTITWPRRVGAQDMLDGWRSDGQAFACPFHTGQTRLFRLARR